MKTNTLSFWNLTSSCIFISYFLSCAINVFVIVVCPDLSKRVWSVLIIISELFLNIISVICSMIQTYQTIGLFFLFFFIFSYYKFYSFIRFSRSSERTNRFPFESVSYLYIYLFRILNVVPGVNIFSEQLIKAVKME